MPGQPMPMPGQPMPPMPMPGQPMPMPMPPPAAAGSAAPNLAQLLALLHQLGSGGAPPRPIPAAPPRVIMAAPPPGAAAASGTAPSPLLAAARSDDQLSQLLKLLKSFLPPQALAGGLDEGGAAAPIGARSGMRQP